MTATTKDVNARNNRAKAIVTKFIRAASESPLTLSEKKRLPKELAILERLIPVKVNGFRGVVITGIVGMALDSDYRPTKDFYGCNPRSIFEQGIYYALKEARIPCGKSDPLNVAKNIQKLDYDWAQGRHPQDSARAAVDYLNILEKAWPNRARRYLVIKALFGRLVEYATYSDQAIHTLTRTDKDLPIDVATRLYRFAVDCPEGGTIPQFIVGNLIRLLRIDDTRYKSVGGIGESVFGTNTTSKKPADIWEILADESFGELYEITVKKIDLKRLDDCVESLISMSITNRTITFICNIPKDIESLGLFGNSVVHKGVGFQFLDIGSFIINIFCVIGANAQIALVTQLQDFAADTNRGVKTKDYWNSIFLKGCTHKV